MKSKRIIEAMDRRSFLGRLGGAIAGVGLAQLPFKSAAPVNAIDPNMPWTWRMQKLFNKSRELFIQERTHGYASKGVRYAPMSRKAASELWAKNAQNFAKCFQVFDPELHARYKLYSGTHVEFDPTGTQPLKAISKPNQTATEVQNHKLKEYERQNPTPPTEQKKSVRQEFNDRMKRQRDRDQEAAGIRADRQAARDKVRQNTPAIGRNARELPRNTMEAHDLVETLLNG